MSEVTCVWPAGAIVGEGPLWVEDENAVYWVDIKAPALHRYGLADGARRTWPMPEPIGWVAERSTAKSFVAGFKSGFAFLDREEMTIEAIGDPEPEHPGNRLNDAKVDAAGRIWAGTMDDDESEATGSLYRLDPDLTWRRMDGPYVVANGPTFSRDQRTLYHTDSAARKVYAFDMDADGELSNKRLFLRFGEGDGFPDGMTVDAEGYIWVAHWGGWRVTRFTPEGTVDRSIPRPVAQVSSCTFTGADLDRLFITTAAIGVEGAAREEQPLAGGLFEVDPGVRGLPTRKFAG